MNPLFHLIYYNLRSLNSVACGSFQGGIWNTHFYDGPYYGLSCYITHVPRSVRSLLATVFTLDANTQIYKNVSEKPNDKRAESKSYDHKR